MPKKRGTNTPKHPLVKADLKNGKSMIQLAVSFERPAQKPPVLPKDPAPATLTGAELADYRARMALREKCKTAFNTLCSVAASVGLGAAARATAAEARRRRPRFSKRMTGGEEKIKAENALSRLFDLCNRAGVRALYGNIETRGLAERKRVPYHEYRDRMGVEELQIEFQRMTSTTNRLKKLPLHARTARVVQLTYADAGIAARDYFLKIHDGTDPDQRAKRPENWPLKEPLELLTARLEGREAQYLAAKKTRAARKSATPKPAAQEIKKHRQPA